jgi:hypothetical protein
MKMVEATEARFDFGSGTFPARFNVARASLRCPLNVTGLEGHHVVAGLSLGTDWIFDSLSIPLPSSIIAVLTDSRWLRL